jgi:hypothetical protein
MITTPVGPTFVKNTDRSGAKSGDHTHRLLQRGQHHGRVGGIAGLALDVAGKRSQGLLAGGAKRCAAGQQIER